MAQDRQNDKNTFPSFMEGWCWLNGEIMPVADAKLSVMDHGVLYGDGVFEGIRFYHGRLFLMEAHLQRLWESARGIDLDLPYSREELNQACERLIETSGLTSGYIRLVVTRGEGCLGVDSRSCLRANVFMVLQPLQMQPEEKRQQGIEVIISSTRRLRADMLDVRIKSLNYLNNLLAKQEANRQGADDAILLNDAGRVAEASVSNVFIYKNQRLITPPSTEGALHGITRQLILQLATELGIEVVEAPLMVLDLLNAEECFLSGTGAEMIRVGKVNHAVLPETNTVFKRLQVAFRSYIDSLCG